MISLKKELKRARLFEVQKLTRRIRTVEKRRGTQLQLEKNQRKVQRLKHQLELLKEVNVSELCSRILAKDKDTLRLATQEQAPADCEAGKVKWRLLSSKTVRGYLLKMEMEEEKSSSCGMMLQDDQVPEFDPQDNRSTSSDLAIPELSTQVEDERGREQCVPDKRSGEHFTADRKAGSSKEIREKGLRSVFITSLSGIKGGQNKKQKRKAVIHRNRLGQRARRKLWEQRYGSSAKHLSKTKAKRTRTRAVGDRVGRVRSRTREVRSPNEADGESKPLHPSWTAKKQQQTAIQHFQGQKIVFDSD